MKTLFFFLACLAVIPLATSFEQYCRWTDRRWPPGRHARPRHGRHVRTRRTVEAVT